MRKLSELYQVVLDCYYKIDANGICIKISRCDWELGVISTQEKIMLNEHFEFGEHELQPKLIDGDYLWPENEDLPRIEYLEYLIKLCKEQDI